MTFDHILMWPLLLHDTRENKNQAQQRDRAARIKEWTDEITARGQGPWQQINTTTDDDFRQPYDEVVYFHPFVRKFLYDHTNKREVEFAGGVNLFERDDIVGVKTELDNDINLQLAALKVQLFLFDSEVAIVVVRLTNESTQRCPATGPLPIDDVLSFQEVFRRCYPPFWMKGETPEPGCCPRKVEWVFADSTKSPTSQECRSNYTDQSAFRDFVHDHVQSPVAAHFQYLLGPLSCYQSRYTADRSWLAYRQILDERIPVMSYLAVDDPQKLTEADFFRLTYCDSPGSHPSVFPYSVGSPDVREFPGKYVYDRFWGPKYRDDDSVSFASRAAHSWATTRYLCSGFAFSAVGASNDGTFAEHIRRHMQHHYFKLGLIAHFGRATLLRFDDRLAYAVQKRDAQEPNSDAKFHQDVKRIEDDFVTFHTRYWFSEVSNHIQPRELFSWWCGHLEVDDLFDQVHRKIQTVSEVLERQATEQLNDRIERLTYLSVGLTLLSLVLAGVTLARDYFDLKINSSCCHIFGFVIAFSLIALVSLVLGRWLVGLVKSCIRQKNRRSSV